MKKIVAMLAAGVMIGAFAAAQAKLPAAPAKSEEQKKAEADKAAATKAKDAENLNKATEKAVSNYKRNKGASMDAKAGQKK